MKPFGSLIGSLLIAATVSFPAFAETLVSDSGLTRIYEYQFSHFPGDVISYTTQVGGRTYGGVINVTNVSRGTLTGWFSDRSSDYSYGCTGNVTIRFVGNNRYAATWQTTGSYSPRVTCVETGQTFRLNMTAYP